jgi:ketosteroid isomerase-like protein
MHDTLSTHVTDLLALLARADTLTLIERYYAPDVCVFENHVLARMGRDACLAHERKQLSKLQGPLQIKVHGHAINEVDGVVFIQSTLRFTGSDGRPMRLDEVAVQRWHRDLITEERFYYEGLIDEGDE